MKKDNIKKDIKIVRKAKPSLRGVALKSANKNSNRGAVAPHPNPCLPTGRLSPQGERETNFLSLVWERMKVRDFKRWHKLSAAFVSIAIIGIVVFFQFAPENAMRGIFESFAV